MKIAIYGDMHLSDISDTPQEAVLDWATDEINSISPDACICIGDVSACGSAEATKRYIEKINTLSCKHLVVVGNSDIRNKSTAPEISDLLKTPCDGVLCENYRIIGIDNFRGFISQAEMKRLDSVSTEEPLILVSHIPPESMKKDSVDFIRTWIKSRREHNRKILLWLSGHTHIYKKEEFESVPSVTVRALDPDKNIGGLPHILIAEISEDDILLSEKLFENNMLSQWTADEINEFADYLGITCYNIPDDMKFAVENGVKHIEWRCAEEQYLPLLQEWRSKTGGTFSVHMPSLGFNDGKVTGAEKYRKIVADAVNAVADMVTVHPPAVCNRLMLDGGKAFTPLADAMADILKPIVDAGILIVFENNHTPAGTCCDTMERDFGCTPEELHIWKNAVEERLGKNISRFRLDIGHARNNVPVSQNYTLGKWYSLLGKECGAYHVHQTIMDEKGLMHNHHPIFGWHGKLISLDSFLWAWHTGMLHHSPIILEIREGEGAPATWTRLQNLLKGIK